MQLNEMAKTLDVSPSFLSGVETGRKAIPKEWPEKITEILKLTPEASEELQKCVDGHPGIKKINAETAEAAELLAAFTKHQNELDGSQLCMLTTMLETQAKGNQK